MKLYVGSSTFWHKDYPYPSIIVDPVFFNGVAPLNRFLFHYASYEKETPRQKIKKGEEISPLAYR
jgi:hypothetical protein